MLALFPYKMGSKGAKALAQGLGIKRIKKEGSRFRGRPTKTVINWGNGSLTEEVAKCRIINNPDGVNRAGNKLLTFNRFDQFSADQAVNERTEVNFPDFTDSREKAHEWIDEGVMVVARTVLRGHSGDGIVLCDAENELVDAPLYVKYVKKSQEYRVHVFRGEILDQQRKARRQETPDEEVNWKIRNHTNGFIFMREGVDLPEEALEQAKLAIDALGLDFGAVDLIYNQRQDKYYVLEVNTAPGLTGTTLEKYKEAFSGI